MSELGPLSFGKKDEQIFLGREIAQHRDYSEETAIKIDQQVRKLVEDAYSRARAIISTLDGSAVQGACGKIYYLTMSSKHSYLYALAVIAVSAHGATLCVNPGGTSGCFAHINDAISGASVSDTIKIAPGTYKEAVAITKSLSLAGESGAIVDATGLSVGIFVDGLNQHRSERRGDHWSYGRER